MRVPEARQKRWLRRHRDRSRLRRVRRLAGTYEVKSLDGDLVARARALKRRLLTQAPEERLRVLRTESETFVHAFDDGWAVWAQEGQVPQHGDWTVWLLMAGRGFGKTRAGAEWVSAKARAVPEAKIALVAATPEEARRVMVEGRSGLLACALSGERRAMRWEPGNRRLVFASGAEAFVYSGADGESLRGPEHHFAWCDELAKWRRARATWDNLLLGLRAGDGPQAVVTTTPKAVPALKAILGMEAPELVVTGGRTRDNPFNAPGFAQAMERLHGGKRLGRQELDGELVEDLDGALFPRAMLERARHAEPVARESLWRVVIGVDPPASAGGDECGIVVCGRTGDDIAYVLEDASAGGLSPEQWARRVAAAAERWRADRIIAEGNQGGQMVETVLRGAGLRLPVRRVHATVGKVRRAEPVAALFESGEAKLAGAFPTLEDQLAGLVLGGDYQGPGRSPDRADALVWALTELMLRKRAVPRIIGLSV
ncbi:MAG: DNA-packaging protein [Alphaproteobacteria bacterium]|nr:DNA-packaging protein [Alphaproteobacteria bacterium]